MASTITLANSISWVQPFLLFKSLTLGTGNEPSISNANIVLQTILGPPFTWRWNRSTTTFTTIAGTQDYSVNVSTFGFMEKASVATTDLTIELEQKNILGLGAEQGRPQYIAAQSDSNAGAITFRVLPIPDTANAGKTVTVTFQKKPNLFSATSGTWSPIPDEYSYIYQRGFLALSMEYSMDDRFQLENQKFVSHLLGAAEGLTEMQKNIFLGNWLNTSNQVQAANIKTQQGNAGRGT